VTNKTPQKKNLVVMPAAGSGSRLGSQVPKPLVKVLGQPLIQYAMNAWKSADPDCDVAVIINPAFENLWKSSVSAEHYLFQEQALGMGDAISKSLSLWSGYENIFVAWADTVWMESAQTRSILKEYLKNPPPSFLVPATKNDPAYISLCLNSAGQVFKVLERREGDGPEMMGSCLSDLGVFLFSASLEPLYRSYMSDAEWGIGRQTKEKNFLAFMSYLTKNKIPVRPLEVDISTPVVGINTPAELKSFEDYLNERK